MPSKPASCPNCGLATVSADARYCRICGLKLDTLGMVPGSLRRTVPGWFLHGRTVRQGETPAAYGPEGQALFTVDQTEPTPPNAAPAPGVERAADV